jgi:hypothetical protein
MSVRRLGFLSLLVLAPGLSTPAFSQTVSRAAGSTDDTKVIGDFSGTWVHPYFPGIEPPASGPGPIVNRSRRPNGTPNNGQFVGDYTNPILKPEAAADTKQPVLALRDSVHLFSAWRANIATAAPDRFPLSAGPRIPPCAAERGSPS